MRIEVTADDIEMGKRGSSCDCPIAKAVARTTGMDAKVGLWFTQIDGVRIRHSAEVRAFMAVFDAGHHVTPFAFDLPDWDLPPTVAPPGTPTREGT